MAEQEGEKPNRLNLFDAERGLYFVPIRHHSPACAWHLRALIAEVQPRQILIEGPVDFEPLIDVLLDAATRPPVAIVAFAGEKDDQHISYFPFSSHAPEYIALTEGRRRGARLAFIDLPAGHRLSMCESDVVAHSFADERTFSMSDYTRTLCQRTGCRDQNELWDHLFETQIGVGHWREFFAATGEYCASVRATVSQAEMTADATLAREQHMRLCLGKALEQEGPIVVVTGGFHTPALINHAQTEPQITSRQKITPARSYLIRYGFQELDRLNGYAAGLPLPLYYERLWQQAGQGEGDKSPQSTTNFWHIVAAELLTQFTTHLRKERPSLLPALPTIANALEHAVRLANLRDRPGPTRQDILDAAQSCFVKGEVTPGATPLLDELSAFLTGDTLGDVPPSAGSPPLVEMVRAKAKRFGFDLSFASKKTRELDIYRNERHREVSRFLHAMAFINASLGTRVKGPDFFAGYSEDLLFEGWTVAWSPMVEAKLIELSRYGETLDDVALVLWRRQLESLGDNPEANRGLGSIRLLLTACQIGLQARIGEILPVIEDAIIGDANIATVTEALSQLFLLWRARGVLGMVGSADIGRLAGVAYRRALYLLGDLKYTKVERLKETVHALVTLREVVKSAVATDEEGAKEIDPALLDEAVERRLDDYLEPVLAGAIAALAFLGGMRDSAFLVERISGHLAGAYTDVADNVAALNGVMAISPELVWRLPELLGTVDELVSGFDEERFVEQLPHLRLAFASLNPRETDDVAVKLAERHNVESAALQAPVAYGISEEELAVNLMLSRDIQASLAADGLEDWVK